MFQALFVVVAWRYHMVVQSASAVRFRQAEEEYSGDEHPSRLKGVNSNKRLKLQCLSFAADKLQVQ